MNAPLQRWLYDALPGKVPGPAAYRARGQNHAFSADSQQSQLIPSKPAQNPRIPRFRPKIPTFALLLAAMPISL